MSDSATPAYTSFDGHRRIAAGPLPANALAVKRALAAGAAGPVLIFDDATGRTIDVDLRGTDDEIAARLGADAPPARGPGATDAGAKPRGRGRPKLGVVPREVTLLPRHWEWLAAQPGGASVTLRKLVEQARRADGGRARARKAQERAYHFMSAIGGDLPGFEEAIRALFANDRAGFAERIAAWPKDVREHATRLAFGHEDGEDGEAAMPAG